MIEEKQQNSGQTKKCAKCKEDVLKSAKKCKHCGSDLRNWFMRHKIISLILIVFILGIIGGGSNEDSKNKSVNNIQAEVEKVDILKDIDYKIVKEEDISYALANRFNIRVIINNNPVTENQIKVVSEKIVNDYKTKKADALSIFYYFDETQVDGSYSLAMAEWAPNGDWSKADLKKDQILTYKFTDNINKERPSSVSNNINQEEIVPIQLNENKDDIKDSVEVESNQENNEKTEIVSSLNNETNSESQELPIETKSSIEDSADTIIESHCQSEWPNDAKMKVFCKEQQYNGLTTLSLNKPSDINESQFLTIREHCKNQWPTDFKMRAYCEGQQFDGVRTLNNGKPADIGDIEFNVIRPKCENEWLTDFKMRAYCEGQQYDAIRTLNQGKPTNVSESDFNSARLSCANEWSTDYKMRVYCENNKY